MLDVVIGFMDSFGIIIAFIGILWGGYKTYTSLSEKYDGVTFNKYCEDLSSVSFLQFRMDVIADYYKSTDFPVIFGKKYPIQLYKSGYENYPFNQLESSVLISSDVPEIEKKFTKNQKIFLKKISSVVKRPKNLGYQLESINFNEHNEFISFTAKPCYFIQTLSTCFSLEYEIYKQYRTRNKDLQLFERTALHAGYDKKEIFSSGLNRHSMLSVQALVQYKDHVSGEYKVIISKRSNKVSYSPGTWQFIPCGYFEVFESVDSKIAIESNFSSLLAIFRELLEEVFNEEEFVDNVDGSPTQNILSHDVSKYVLDMLNKRMIEFVFLGTVLDVVTLTHKLSFALVIHDESFSKYKFKPNFETKDMHLLPISKIESALAEDDFFMPESAGLLRLASDSGVLVR